MKNQTLEQQPFLSLQHVEKVYPGGEKAVYDFNLDIQKNEFIVIVGPSGCGKSTTLRMIAGLEDISDGNICMDGELLNYKPCKDRKMAIVFQSYALYPQMNVFDNIAFPLTINKYPMPVVDRVLLSGQEIGRVLSSVAYNKFIGVLYNVWQEKEKTSEKIMDIANLFGISEDAAKFLFSYFSAYKNKTLEELDAVQEDICNEIRGQLSSLCEARRAENVQKGIAVDEACRVLDETGVPKTEMRALTPYEIKTRVYKTAATLDLVPYLDKLPKELSGGQMQRVALGRAIVKDVPVFMMDEPLSNLDAKLRLTMRSEIVKLHNKIGATTIYVTHDQTEAMTMATRIVVMSRGFIQQIGTPEEVYSQPANLFVAKFIGSPSMNIMEAAFDRAANEFCIGGLRIPCGGDFLQKHDEFYSSVIDEFSAMETTFDRTAREKLLRILSATGENRFSGRKNGQKKKFIDRIRALFVKEKTEESFDAELEVCREKLAHLKQNLSQDHPLVLGVRPERIKIVKAEAGKKYSGCTIVKPTVCELLGGEYNVHFDFCGKNMVGIFDAKDKISIEDEIAVGFSPEDVFVFDPVTGGRIA